MGLAFTKLFARLFSKKEMRILMVPPTSLPAPGQAMQGAQGAQALVRWLPAERWPCGCRSGSTQLVRRRSSISSSSGAAPRPHNPRGQQLPTAGLPAVGGPPAWPAGGAPDSRWRSPELPPAWVSKLDQCRAEQLSLHKSARARQLVLRLGWLQRDCDHHPHRVSPPACLPWTCCCAAWLVPEPKAACRSASTWRRWSTRTSPSQCGMSEARTRCAPAAWRAADRLGLSRRAAGCPGQGRRQHPTPDSTSLGACADL